MPMLPGPVGEGHVLLGALIELGRRHEGLGQSWARPSAKPAAIVVSVPPSCVQASASSMTGPGDARRRRDQVGDHRAMPGLAHLSVTGWPASHRDASRSRVWNGALPAGVR